MGIPNPRNGPLLPSRRQSSGAICASASNKYYFNGCESRSPISADRRKSNRDTYAAVAEKISTFLASVNKERARENTDVNTIVKPIRRSIRLTKYKTRMATVGSSDDKIAATELLIVAIRASLYFLNPGVEFC